MKTKANILRAWREAALLSQEDLASKAGISSITVYNLERGRNIQGKKLLAILEALGKSVDDLARESRDSGPAILIESGDGTTTAISTTLTKQAESAAKASGQSLAEWVTLAISAYLRKPPTEASFS